MIHDVQPISAQKHFFVVFVVVFVLQGFDKPCMAILGENADIARNGSCLERLATSRANIANRRTQMGVVGTHLALELDELELQLRVGGLDALPLGRVHHCPQHPLRLRSGYGYEAPMTYARPGYEAPMTQLHQSTNKGVCLDARKLPASSQIARFVDAHARAYPGGVLAASFDASPLGGAHHCPQHPLRLRDQSYLKDCIHYSV